MPTARSRSDLADPPAVSGVSSATATPAMLDRARALAGGAGSLPSPASPSPPLENSPRVPRRGPGHWRANSSSSSSAPSSSSSSSQHGGGKEAHRLTHGGRIAKSRHTQRAAAGATTATAGEAPGKNAPPAPASTSARLDSNPLAAGAAAAGSYSSTPASGSALDPGPAPSQAPSATGASALPTTTTTKSGTTKSGTTTSPSAPAVSSPPINTRRCPPTSSAAPATGATSSLSSKTPPPPPLPPTLSLSLAASLPALPTPSTSSSENPTPPAATSRSDGSSDVGPHPSHSYFTRSSSSSSSNSSSLLSAATSASSGANRLRANQHSDPMAVDDVPVLTFWGPDPVPLPSRFAKIKRNLIAGHEEALEASWARLIRALRDEVDQIEALGAHLIPSIEFSDIHDPAQTARFGHDLRRYGVGVVRRAVPKPDADDMVNATLNYLDTKRTGDVKSVKQDPTCYDYFWTPAQVRARAHPSVQHAQRFMMGLWETSPDDRLATRLPITYVDRIRIHGADGEQRLPLDQMTSATGPGNTDMSTTLEHDQSPQSADDWINALQSSAGIIAQVDNGSLERWEPDGYGHAGTYSSVFRGQWESYDPWECASRVSSTMDLYNGYGACTIFRMFQGVLALSTIEPGMVRLMPSPKLATAYYLLRPFFSPKTSAPDTRSGPEWDAYLDPSNWALVRNPDTIIHGAVPGHAQRITEHWHPHLHLRGSMITLPTLQPGDYIFWHPDLPYHISSSNPGLQTPRRNPDEVSMLVYIPAAPLTQSNALYLARQRKAFQRGHPGPDFDSTGRGTSVEDPETRPGEKDIAQVGGSAGLQAMGLAPWDTTVFRPTGLRDDKVRNGGSSGTNGTVTAGLSSAEADVVKLSNIILFPDRALMGYSV